MYNNLDVERCLLAIDSLFRVFSGLKPDHKFTVATSFQTDSDFNLNIWRQLRNLPEALPVKIKWTHVLQLLRITLLEYPYIVCSFFPQVLYKQM